MRSKRIRVITNPKKPWAKSCASSMKRMLESRGYEFVEKGAGITVCIGGDGTILYANHEGLIQGTILGIGGAKSRICQLRRDNWRKRIMHFLRSGKSQLRQMLFARYGKKQYSAINDFVIHSTDYRIIEIDLWINGKRHSFEGDGVIVSTATGSYAYAYSAGGRRLKPGSKRLQVVPIAPYLRAFRPHILPSSSVVEVSVDRDSAFIVDGIYIGNIRKNRKVRIISKGSARFLREGQ